MGNPESENQYLNSICDAALIGYWELNHYSGDTFMSKEVYQILGIGSDQISNNIYSVFSKCFSPQDRDIIYKKMTVPKSYSTDDWFEIQLLTQSEEYKWIRMKLNHTYDEKNNLVKTIGIIQDISDFKLINYRINEMLELKDAMLEVSHAIIDVDNINDLFEIILDKVTKVMKKTDLACILALTENNELTMISNKGYQLEEGQEFRIKLEDSFVWLKTGGKIEKTVIINDLVKDFPHLYEGVLENKKGIFVRSSMSAPIFIENRFFGLINIDCGQNDIFDETDWILMEYVRKQISIAISKHRLYEETIYLTRHDNLTDIYNRRYFEELINKKIEENISEGKKFHFVIFDLDRLKMINDTYGHAKGDELIIEFSRFLKNSVRDTDIIARFGGDEFVGIFFNIDIRHLVKRMEDLRSGFINKPFIFNENDKCGFSYGIASFPLDGWTYDDLVNVADKRMYEYKKNQK